ncbi:hypothetical protein FSP39_014860 [Pinctada imbricata]|uniref:Purple acid phosphatase n=1 Tax=Pinctada imbricata TaxID=66713 RepID=A0AA88XRH9_PINIB|nr:hypothetical protein FSP39_014860 [Pinctada imbricata]
MLSIDIVSFSGICVVIRFSCTSVVTRLQGLLSGCTYYYKIQQSSGQEVAESQVFNFWTITQSQNKVKPQKYLVYGDLGQEAGKPTFPVLKEEVESGQYETIWHVGDFAYDLFDEGGKRGDHFLLEIEQIAARIPYMTSPGNHEIQNSFHHYGTRFSMPGTTWPMPVTKLWYSYNIGLVHFISYSTEVFFSDNQVHVCKQYDWLLRDLTEANENRDKQPWIVAMGHRPMYCSNRDIREDCFGGPLHYWVRNGLEDLFHSQGVDLIIQAHEHSYERSWPMYREEVTAKNYINPEASVHVTSGAAGSFEGVDKMGKPEHWSAFRADDKSFHSFGKLIIHNQTHIQFIQETVKPRAELDNFWIVQHNHGPRIQELDCQTGEDPLNICRCPALYHYATVSIVVGITVPIVVLVTLFLTVYVCRKRGRCRCFDQTICCSKLYSWNSWTVKFKSKKYFNPLEYDTYNLVATKDVEL